MDKLGLQLLSCLRAYRLDSTAEIVGSFSTEDWQNLYQISGDHKLIPVVYETLRNCSDFCKEDESLKSLWKQTTILQAVGQASRTQRLLALTQAMDEAGISYALVKGALCRQLYRQPDLRLSGDEDLFIPQSHRQRCGEILEKLGFSPVNPREEAFVDHWQDEVSGLHIELHTALFESGWAAEEVLNPWLSQALDHTEPSPVEHSAVFTLNPTAHFVFLLAHALKHFISGGFGARILCDVLAFAQVHHSRIEKETVYQLLEQIQGRIFFDQLLAIGRDYLAFDYESLGWALSAPADYTDLLADMLDAGIYGQTTMDRRHSGALALEALRTGQQKNSLRAALFPSVQRLIGRYPVLKKHPVLLPAVWVHRAGAYGLELLRSRGKGNSPVQTLSLGKKRTEMLVKYGIIPQTEAKN